MKRDEHYAARGLCEGMTPVNVLIGRREQHASGANVRPISFVSNKREQSRREE